MINNHLKKIYSITQLYTACLNGYLALPKLVRNRLKKIVDPKLTERLMLATTEVNGCEVCSYAHTRMALKEGFSQEEISAFLSGSRAFVKEEEATAILYAQHMADTMGNPDPETYERLVEVYGPEKAEIMKASITIMMMGNILGIPVSAFTRRLKGKPYENSSLLYELSMLLAQPVFIVVAIPHAIVKAISNC